MSGLRAPDAPEKMAEVPTQEIPKPKNILLGFDDIKKGGGIERSAQAIMKADPEQFGFDPEDPKLNAKIGQRAHILARGLAKDLGFEGGDGYKEFNKIASRHVQEGDQIRLFRDAATGKPKMEYSGDAFGDASSVPDNIPQAEASVSKVAPVEDMKSGTGAADQQASRARGGKMKLPDEIQEMQDRAQARWREAVQAEQELKDARPGLEAANVRDLAIANERLYLSTRGLLDRIVQDAGVGKRAAFWDQPMSEWDKLISSENYIAQDVHNADVVRKLNLNTDKLRALYPMLKRYQTQGYEKIGECLMRAIRENPGTISDINRIVLRK